MSTKQDLERLLETEREEVTRMKEKLEVLCYSTVCTYMYNVYYVFMVWSNLDIDMKTEIMKGKLSLTVNRCLW